MKCESCNGVGLVNEVQDNVVVSQRVCSTCNGNGFTGEKPVEEKKVTHKKK